MTIREQLKAELIQMLTDAKADGSLTAEDEKLILEYAKSILARREKQPQQLHQRGA